jgi:energy-coupling factor transporter ATP-binding protein EcfA2
MGLIDVDDFLTQPKARAFRLEVEPGSRLAIMGRSATGKSRLLQAVAGAAKRGIKVHSPTISALSGRATPQHLVKPGGSDHAAVVLSMLGLWDVRKTTLANLSESQRRAALFASILHVREGVILLDDDILDRLDPWSRLGAVESLLALPNDVAILVVTNDPTVGEKFPRMLILGSKGLLFEGEPSALLTGMAPIEYAIKTQDREAVRAMVEPFQLEIASTSEGIRFSARENQNVAVDLLLKGYGTVESVMVKSPTFAEALRDLDS